MLRGKAASFGAALVLACMPVLAQQGHDASSGQDRGGSSRTYQDTRGNRANGNYANQQHSRNQNFYNGVRESGHGGQYYDPRHANDGYDQRSERRGGIGPGKGALIGGAGGAVVGAVIGKGLKGSLIGGAAGAGIGAVVGESAQHRRDERH